VPMRSRQRVGQSVTKQEMRREPGERIAQVRGIRRWDLAVRARLVTWIRVVGRERVYDRGGLRRLATRSGLGNGKPAACEREHDRGTRGPVEPDCEGEDARRRAHHIQRARKRDADDTKDEGTGT
jgi:hypothetical protein